MFVFKRAPLAVTRDLFYVAIRLLIQYMYHLRGNYFMQSELFFMIALIYRYLCQCHACKLQSSVIEQFRDDMNPPLESKNKPKNIFMRLYKIKTSFTTYCLRDKLIYRQNIFRIFNNSSYQERNDGHLLQSFSNENQHTNSQT